MQRGEGESLGRKKKKEKRKSILSICLHADLRPKQIEYQKADKREILDFTVQFFGAALIMGLNGPFIFNHCILQLHVIITPKT